MGARRTYLLFLVIAGCGRTGLGLLAGGPDAATSSRSSPEVAGDRVGHSPDGRVCQWTGLAPQVTYEASGEAAIAVADFNGDGYADIVVSAWGNGTPSSAASGKVKASVYLNHGDGTFAAAASTYNTDMETTSVAAGDFSGDGKADFVVMALGTLDIFVNQGDGTFGSLIPHAVPKAALAMATGDFNGDGHLDLAVTTQDRVIDILLGDGKGGFAAPIAYATGTEVDAIAVSDLSGDGYPDIVVTNSELAGTCPGALCLPSGLGAGTVNVLINQGDGTFAPQASYASGNGTASVTVGDLNGDGVPDIAATNSVDNTLSVFFNAGDGTFGPPATYANAGSGTAVPGVGFPGTGGGVVAADFNGDGHSDIVVVQASRQDRNGVVMLFANAGDGRFLSPLTYDFAGSPQALAVADFNGDGLPDLVVTSLDNTRGAFVMGVFLSECR